MCNYSSVIRQEGYDEGFIVGLNEARLELRNEVREDVAREMIKAGGISEEDIAKFSHLSIERVKELKEESRFNT